MASHQEYLEQSNLFVTLHNFTRNLQTSYNSICNTDPETPIDVKSERKKLYGLVQSQSQILQILSTCEYKQEDKNIIGCLNQELQLLINNKDITKKKGNA